MDLSDTIVAISSAVGPAARIIVRASGSRVRQIHEQLADNSSFDPGSARRTSIRFCDLIVPAWVYCFGGPRSATGQDVVEFHIPGNPLLARMLMDQIIGLGARSAEPGEFTARAYFNGRIGLTEAEGVAATIAAQNQRELTAARQLLAGELAHRLRPVLDSVANTLALIEAEIDFSDQDDVSFLSKDQVRQRITTVDAMLSRLLSQSSRFERLSHEPHIVLLGRPNAGKSTLLNALAGHERAVVSEHAGTTRDVIWSHVRLARGMVRVIDVAGIEESESADVIAGAMQDRAARAIEEADLIVLVQDASDERPMLLTSRWPDLLVRTKMDLTPRNDLGRPLSAICISATTGQNLDLLRQRLDELAFGRSGSTEASLALNARHVRAIEGARSALARAAELLSDSGPEILAMELREALDALGQVLGSVSPDELLGRIFSTFCIGK